MAENWTRSPRTIPAGVGPTQMLAALEAAGFTRYHVAESHIRMNWPATARGVGRSLLVPTRRAATNYELLMSNALDELFGTAAAGAAATLALTVLGAREETG